MTTTIPLLPGNNVIVAFISAEAPWSSYGGPGTLVELQPPEMWTVDGDEGEAHWLVRLPDGREGFFPVSSVYRKS